MAMKVGHDACGEFDLHPLCSRSWGWSSHNFDCWLGFRKMCICLEEEEEGHGDFIGVVVRAGALLRNE